MTPTSRPALSTAAGAVAARQPPPLAWDLFRRLEPLCGPVVWEPSVKLVTGRVLDGRFQLSMPPPTPGPNTHALLRYLEGLGLPALYRPACEANLPDASHLHLGVEPGPDGLLLKLYLELSRRRLPGELGDRLVHLAFKWDPDHPDRHVLARYRDRSAADADTLIARIAGICGERAAGIAADAAALVLHVCARRPARDLLLLESVEEGNPRHTFDLCVYDAAIALADLGDWADAVCERFDIPADSRAALRARIGDARLGHFAGGIARDGEPSCTLYYGAGFLHPTGGSTRSIRCRAIRAA